MKVENQGRRTAVKMGFAASAGIVAAPMIAKAQAPIKLKLQSTWPQKSIFHEFCADFARHTDKLSGGRLKFDVLASGAVVPALQVIDGVSTRVIDAGHGVPGFWFGKNSAFGLYGAGPSFAMDSTQMLGWIEYGGGAALYEELLESARMDVVSILHGPVPVEPLGWFRNPINTVADLKGMKFRTSGLAVELFEEMGMAPTQMAPGDIVPALDRGVLDAAEFANATDDRMMGFSDVTKNYYQQSYHMANNVFDLMINKKVYTALPDDLKMTLKYAAMVTNSDISWKSMDRMSTDLLELMRTKKVQVRKTPSAILEAQLQAWEKVIERHSARNPLFKKIVDSQRAWANRVVWWQDTTVMPTSYAYRHYYGKRQASK